MSGHLQQLAAEVPHFLATTELLQDLELADLEQLAAQMETVSLAAGETLIHQGDAADCLYLIRYGTLAISRRDEQGRQTLLGTAAAGKSVGEIALLTGERRSASVVAQEPCGLLKLHQITIDSLHKKSPEIAALLTERIVKRLQRTELQDLLHSAEFYRDLDGPTLADLEKELELTFVPSGHELIREGDQSAELYIVISGRLQVVDHRGDQGERRLLELGRGQTVGEMAIFTGARRTASVRTLRDSLLARLTADGFSRLLQAHPEAMSRHFAGKVIERLWRQTLAQPKPSSSVVSIAIVPTHPEAPLAEFTAALAGALETHGATLHLSSQLLNRYLSRHSDPNSLNMARWLNQQESSYRFILYQTDPQPTPWTERCLRQADRVLLVAKAWSAVKPGAIETGLLQQPRFRQLPQTLALLHVTPLSRYQRSREWLAQRPVSRHYHVRYREPGAMRRLARLLAGKGIGLVLGGGGARGFAHLGGIRALRERGITIDTVGGTSMGAIVAGMTALGWNYEAMLRAASGFNYKMDYTFPLIALTTGGHLTHGLRKEFGEHRIEDLEINFFCVSTDLACSAPEIHRSGVLWQSIRASASIPGIFPPVVDGDKLLVDGGMVNNLPVDVMRGFEDIGTIIAFDVSGPVTVDTTLHFDGHISGWKLLARLVNPFRKGVRFPSLPKTLVQSALTKSVESAIHTRNLADYYCRFPVDGYGLLAFEKFTEIAGAGYAHVREQLAEQWQDIPASEENPVDTNEPVP